MVTWKKIKLAVACVAAAVAIGGVGTPVVMQALAQEKRAGDAKADKDRIGFAEEFDSMDGWTVSRGPIGSMKSENGIGVFETHIHKLPAEINGMKVTGENFTKIYKPGGEKPDDAGKSVGGKLIVFKEYDQEVDLDKYHYIVMKTDWKPMFAMLYIGNDGQGKDQVHVAHSTGVIAQDLEQMGFKGKRKIKFTLRWLNNGGKFKTDYIRLVSRLTEEEKKGLILPPVKVPKEGIKRHPYQEMEALWQRAPRPWTPPKDFEEQVLFRDAGTNIPVWRMTSSPAHEGLKGRHKPNVWRKDGSSMTTPGRTYYFAKHKWGREGGKYWAGKATGEKDYAIERNKDTKKVIFKQRNPETKEMEVIYEHPFPNRQSFGFRHGVRGTRMIAVFVGAEVIMVDAAEKDKDKMVKVHPIPPIGCKGLGIAHDYISISCPWISIHRTIVDLNTGKITEGFAHTLTHGAGGREYSIMTYGWEGVAKVVYSKEAYFPAHGATPGKYLQILAVYDPSVPVTTDYGEMTSDSLYGFTNGTKGELGNQFVLFDRKDGGTILRLCTYNVSYCTWDLRAKVKASPDYTKLAWASDMMGDNADYYMGIVRRPYAPKNVKAEKAGGGVKLAWELPVPAAEIKGYNIYRSSKSGLGYKRINKELIAGTEFTDAEAPAGRAVFYVVTAEEHSGLVSIFSKELSVNLKDEPVILHYEAEEAKLTRPVRKFVDGYASNCMAVRVTKVRADEDVGNFAVAVDIPRAKDYWVWGRCRGYRPESKGKFSLQVGGKDAASFPVEAPQWKWVKSSAKVKLSPGAELALVSGDNLVMIDKIIVTDDEKYSPATPDDRKAAPEPVKGLTAALSPEGMVSLSWEPSPDPDIYCYSVYVGEKPDFALNNGTILTSPHKPAAFDWGLKLNTKYYYKVVTVDKLANESKPAVAEVDTSALRPVTVEVPLANAQPSEGLQKATHLGAECYVYPSVEAGKQTLKYDFEVPADGEYYVWLQYIPTYNVKIGYGEGVGVMVDGKNAGRMLIPVYTPRGGAAKKRWFYGRLKNRAKLSKGKHSFTIVFDKSKPTGTKRGQRVSKFWVTNDVSFAPSGYTPQIMFSKAAKWERK